jgi:hypothetical protein
MKIKERNDVGILHKLVRVGKSKHGSEQNVNKTPNGGN